MFYYSIYMLETKEHQSGSQLLTHPSLQPKLAGKKKRCHVVWKKLAWNFYSKVRKQV